VKKEDLPKTFEFLTRKELVGRVAIDKSDTEWLSAIFKHYGEQRGRKLAQEHPRWRARSSDVLPP
jgi:hypothetical protein